MVILGRLGRGGTSHVFKAQSTRNKQLYAMKVIDKKAKNYNHAALQRELKIHRALFNPYVIRLEGHFEDCENHYVLTEYCEGGEMTRLIAEDLSEEKLANVVHQIVIALTYLHSQNIAHCDLKLSNLLLHKGRIVALP
jgi:serine/threonine protein kinase